MFGIGPRVRKSTPLLCLPFSPSLFLQFRVNNERAAFGIPSALTTLTQGLLVASAWSVFYIYVCVCVCICCTLARMCTPIRQGAPRYDASAGCRAWAPRWGHPRVRACTPAFPRTVPIVKLPSVARHWLSSNHGRRNVTLPGDWKGKGNCRVSLV